MRRRILAVGASAIVLAGGGIAVAAGTRSGGSRSGSATRPPSILDDAAKRLGVTPDKLRAALTGAMKDRIEQAVKAGRLTRKQADRLEQHLGQGPGLGLGFGLHRRHRWGPPGPGRHLVPPAAPRRRQFRGGPPMGPGHGPPGGFGRGPRFGPPPGPVRAGLTVAARYLGLKPAELARRLGNGNSLADVAKAEHKDLAGLKSAIRTAIKARLDRAVAAGHLPRAMADRLLKGLDAHLDDLLHRHR